jgi:hypothetical protein
MKSLIGLLLIFSSLAQDTSKLIPINASALSGILISLMLVVFLSIGLCALVSINGPTVYSSVPLLVGKER